MSYLKPGTLCITLKRRDPRNAGRIVRILKYVGDVPPDVVDGYMVEAENGVPFATTIWRDAEGNERFKHNAVTQCRVSRAYLRPLVDPDLDVDEVQGNEVVESTRAPLDAAPAELVHDPEVIR